MGQAGTFTVTSRGFPFASFAAVTLPAGLTFTDNGNGTATISGVPQAGTANSYTITLTAQQGTVVAKQVFTLAVLQPSTITSANTITFSVGKPGSFTIATAGFPNAKIKEAGALPAGITFKSIGNGKATLSGTPKVHKAATFTITISAADGVLPAAFQVFTLNVM